MPTIRDVAAKAGVSIGTVSRVLAGSDSTSEASRSQVRAAVEALGYAPNARAQSLRLLRTGVLGLSISDVRNPFFAEIAHAAEQEALRHGYVTMLGNANEDMAQEVRYLDTFASQRVDGVLMSPQGADGTRIQRLLDHGTPVVFVDRTLENVAVPSVTSDSRMGMGQALEYLAGRGHTRVGYVGGPVTVSTGRARLAAFQSVRAELQLDLDDDLVYLGDYRQASGAAALAHFLALPSAPTAVVTGDSLMALGTLVGLRERGLWLGEEIEVVSFDDVDWMSLITPGLTAIAHDAAAMGTLGMRLLLERIAGAAPAPMVLPTHIVTRGTVR